MFGLGMPEILLILAIALIVIGPKKLPDLAKTLGRAMGEFKRSAQDFKRSIDIDSTVKDITDLDPPESNLKEALKAANDEASAPDADKTVFTRESSDSKETTSSSNTMKEKSKKDTESDPSANGTTEPLNPDKDDSINHE